MDYLQYFKEVSDDFREFLSFKPYYKWITFNTPLHLLYKSFLAWFVLNLIINGLPSILSPQAIMSTINGGMVLNLIINGLPSILEQFLFEPVGLIKF